MALDISQAIQLMTHALLQQLGDEVDLIFRYGSHINGATHQYSDIDISYVPVHESTHHAITIMVEDTLIDLYPIRWSSLEDMANFDNVSCTVLLQNEIVYQRTDTVAERFRTLSRRLRELQQPEARPMMLRKAQENFQNTGYPYYLLQQSAKAGHALACMHHARNILYSVLHCLKVCNQACIDTRKRDQILALPKLPENFAETIDRVTTATDPQDIRASCETLLNTTRDLLLAEQQDVQRGEASFPKVLNSAYPELKGDIQHLMLACERRDMFGSTLTSLYHELMIHMAQAITGIAYSDFNNLPEYEQDLVALGFPDLLPYVAAQDYDGLHEQCQVFDQRLQTYLTEKEVALNKFDTLDELATYLKL